MSVAIPEIVERALTRAYDTSHPKDRSIFLVTSQERLPMFVNLLDEEAPGWTSETPLQVIAPKNSVLDFGVVTVHTGDVYIDPEM
jgi:hypothetical protein